GRDDEMSCAHPQIDLDLELTPLPKLQLLEDPMDPLQELAILEGLGDEVVRPQREALQDVLGASAVGQQDEGNAPGGLGCLDRLAEGVTVQFGHDNIGDDEVRRGLAHEVEA